MICPHCHNEIPDEPGVTLLTVRGRKQSVVKSGVLVDRWKHQSPKRKIQEVPLVCVAEREGEPVEIELPINIRMEITS